MMMWEAVIIDFVMYKEVDALTILLIKEDFLKAYLIQVCSRKLPMHNDKFLF
jgi:hypothetical protein